MNAYEEDLALLAEEVAEFALQEEWDMCEAVVSCWDSLDDEEDCMSVDVTGSTSDSDLSELGELPDVPPDIE